MNRDPGAPLDLYVLLQPAGEPEIIDAAVPPGAEILDLGCGTGRVTNALVARGRKVAAVDFDERMLEHVRGAETVLSRIEHLDLGRTFGGVVMMSNLINTGDVAHRQALLATCRRHVAPDGVVLIERYDPVAGLDTTPTERHHAGIVIRTSDIRREGDRLYQKMEFDAAERGKWTYQMDGAPILDDNEVMAALAAADLRLERWLDLKRRWLVARPA